MQPDGYKTSHYTSPHRNDTQFVKSCVTMLATFSTKGPGSHGHELARSQDAAITMAGIVYMCQHFGFNTNI